MRRKNNKIYKYRKDWLLEIRKTKTNEVYIEEHKYMWVRERGGVGGWGTGG